MDINWLKIDELIVVVDLYAFKVTRH